MFTGRPHRRSAPPWVAALVAFTLTSASFTCQSGATDVLVDHLCRTLYTERPDRYPNYTRLTEPPARATPR
ncbi:MAG: hypothetical protein MK320_08530, partial [Gammaproteobacteria bacterium]|nr:hypothetical protein [Gammaproteobacteria bacterium]